MPAPSRLAVASSAVRRLVKEEHSYSVELAQSEKRIQALKADDGHVATASNVQQEEKAVKETEKMLPTLRKRLLDALERLDEVLNEPDAEWPEEEKTEAEAAKKLAEEATEAA